MSICNGQCHTGMGCTCGQYYNPTYNPTYTITGPTLTGIADDQKIDQIYQTVHTLMSAMGTLATRLEDLENMLVDINSGIDEILDQRTVNKEDHEKVCRCSEAGCESCVTSGDAADSGEPSSSREEVSEGSDSR